jgi:hypothetical protein
MTQKHLPIHPKTIPVPLIELLNELDRREQDYNSAEAVHLHPQSHDERLAGTAEQLKAPCLVAGHLK